MCDDDIFAWPGGLYTNTHIPNLRTAYLPSTWIATPLIQSFLSFRKTLKPWMFITSHDAPLTYLWLILWSTLLMWNRAVSQQFMPIVGSWWQYIIKRNFVVFTAPINDFSVRRRNCTLLICSGIHPSRYILYHLDHQLFKCLNKRNGTI